MYFFLAENATWFEEAEETLSGIEQPTPDSECICLILS